MKLCGTLTTARQNVNTISKASAVYPQNNHMSSSWQNDRVTKSKIHEANRMRDKNEIYILFHTYIN